MYNVYSNDVTYQKNTKGEKEMKRNVKQMVLVFLVLCLVFVVGIDTFAASKKAKSVTLNHKEYTVKKGKSVKLKATVSPKNAKNKKIEWSSSNKKVATVNSKGKVTAKKQGTAKITAKVKGTKIKAVCKITVGQPISKITVKEKKVTLFDGETAKVNTTIKPAKASNKKLAYSSSNESVVTVDAKGVMTAKASGTATVTVKATDGSKKKATVKVTVNKKTTEDKDAGSDNEQKTDQDKEQDKNQDKEQDKDQTVDQDNNHVVHVTGVTLSPSSKALKVNETVKLVSTVLPENATNKNVTFGVVSGNDIVSVDASGLVTANAVGTAVVSVVTEDGQKKATCQIIVTESGGTQIGSKIKTVTGVVSISETEPAIGAKIYLIPYRNETTKENLNLYIDDAPYATQTNENGEYRLEGVSVGYYYLLVKCAGYMDVSKAVSLTEYGPMNHTVEKIQLVETGANGEDLPNCTLSGTFSQIKDSKKLIAGLTVRLREGKNNLSGDYLQETYTDEKGEYSFENLMPGIYTLQVTDLRQNEEVGYFSEYYTVDVCAGIHNIRSGQLYPIYAGDEIRFVLHWNDKASGASVNLNSHLIGPKYGNSGELHIWHGAMECYEYMDSLSAVLSADLYCDGFDGGPEKTTIYVPQDGEYEFYVFDYLTKDKTGAMKLANSSPIVEVYQGCNLRTVYEMPKQAGNLWYVCSYNKARDCFVERNTVSDWTDEEKLIGVDQLKISRDALLETLKKASVVSSNLEESKRENFNSVFEQVQAIYDTSNDITELDEANELLTYRINLLENLVKITKVQGDGLLSYRIDDKVDKIYMEGLTSSIPECEWETNSDNTIDVIVDKANYQQIVVTNPNGYEKVYDVVYTWNEEQCLGIKSVQMGADVVDFNVQKSQEGNFYILNVLGYKETLGSDVSVKGSNTKADIVLEESDKEGYVKKVTIRYKNERRVYYVTYRVNPSMFDVATVTDGENYIVSFDHSGDETSRILQVTGYEAHITYT